MSKMYFKTFSVSTINTVGVLSMGGDSVAAAVSESFSVILVVYSADTSQDAASGLPAAGITVFSRQIISIVCRSTEPKALTEFL